MGANDPRMEAYIAKSADFAKPILTHLRKLVHTACPNVEEAMKWSAPHFLYKGMLCSMAAFKAHCAFGFWKGSLIFGGDKVAESEAMGQFGRITSLSDLPSDKKLIAYVRQAMKLNDAGVKVEKPKPAKKKESVVPPDLVSALKKNKKAKETFDNFSPSHRREYVDWITEAKREETRKQRLDTAVEWMAKGKSRHWKYAKC